MSGTIFPASVMMGASVALVALLLLFAHARMRPMARRARRYARARERQERAGIPGGTRRDRLAASLEDLLARLGLDGKDARQGHENALAQAGLRGVDSVVAFQAAVLVMPTVGVFAGALVAPLVVPEPDAVALLGVAAVGMLLGAGLPRLWLTNRRQKRQTALSRSLADALDLYVICAEAGLSLDAAMTRVARELKPVSPPLADELGLTAIELGFLPNRHEAYSNLLRRVPLPIFRGLVGMFQQTERYGTPLADALRHLAADHRTSSMMRAEEKAARLPAVLTVPMILFVLPPLFVVLIGPAILQWVGRG